MKKKLNKKKVISILILLIAIITLIFLIGRTFSRYESKANINENIDVAFWVVDDTFKTQTIVLEDIYPSDDEYTYEFSVLNNDGTKVAETALQYEIVITTTTNMPLTYRIEKNGNPCTIEETLSKDSSNTYTKSLRLNPTTNGLKFDKTRTEQFTKKVKDDFVLYVTFPESYKNHEEYADLIECIDIQLTATQIIS